MHLLFGFEFRGDISIQNYQMSQLMLVYSFGFLSVFLVLFFFYFRVYKKRVQIELNNVEILITKMSMESHSISAIIAIFSIILSSFGFNALSGWIYFFVGPVAAFNGYRRGKQIDRLKSEKDK